MLLKAMCLCTGNNFRIGWVYPTHSHFSWDSSEIYETFYANTYIHTLFKNSIYGVKT